MPCSICIGWRGFDVPPDRARAVLLLLTFYPFSIFYGAPYTESVFLLEAVAAFYYIRKGDPVKAGLAGLLAGLTRPNGCVLAAPLMCLALGLNGAWREGLRSPRRWPQGLIIAAVMPIVGVLLVLAVSERAVRSSVHLGQEPGGLGI